MSDTTILAASLSTAWTIVVSKEVRKALSYHVSSCSSFVCCAITGIYTRGSGHLHQGPFKSFPVGDDAHFLTVCRYVERNALRANLVERAEDWQFGSLHRWHHRCDRAPQLLSAWPIRRPSGWTARTNTALTQPELDSIRTCVSRGRPYGSEEWTEEICERTGTWSSIRRRGRPRKKPKTSAVQTRSK